MGHCCPDMSRRYALISALLFYRETLAKPKQCNPYNYSIVDLDDEGEMGDVTNPRIIIPLWDEGK